MWLCELTLRLTRLTCSPESSADMKTITDTPTPTPTMINRLCVRPSRKKRVAAIHSKGSQGDIAIYA